MAEQQLSRLAPSACKLSADVRIFGARLPEGAWHGPRNFRLKFEMSRQERSLSLCATVREVPWEDEAEPQLSRLAPSACQLTADFSIFGAGLTEASGKDNLSYV